MSACTIPSPWIPFPSISSLKFYFLKMYFSPMKPCIVYSFNRVCPCPLQWALSALYFWYLCTQPFCKLLKDPLLCIPQKGVSNCRLQPTNEKVLKRKNTLEGIRMHHTYDKWYLLAPLFHYLYSCSQEYTFSFNFSVKLVCQWSQSKTF